MRGVTPEPPAPRYPAAEVPALEGTDVGAFGRFVRDAEPVKLLGAIEHWPLRRALREARDPMTTIAALEARTAGERVTFAFSPPEARGVFGVGLSDGLEPELLRSAGDVPIERFFDWARKLSWNGEAGSLYMRATRLRSLEAGLGPLDALEGFSPRFAPRFWVGTGGQRVPLHNDPDRNLLVLLAGRKRVLLLPPERLPDVYPAPSDKETLSSLVIDAFDPDLARYPRFERALAHARVVDLAPGDALYLPPLWWHAVASTGLNVAVNAWFPDDGDAARVRSLHRPALDALTEAERGPSRARFAAALRGEGADASDPSSRRGAEIHGRLATSDLGEGSRGAWKRWVQTYMDVFAFGAHGDPFPTLEGDRRALLREIPRPSKDASPPSTRPSHPMVPASAEPPRALALPADRVRASATVHAGAFLETDVEEAVGSRLRVRLGDDPDVPALDALVQWVSPPGLGPPGLGVTWVQPEAWERARLRLAGAADATAVARLRRLFDA